MPVYQNMWIHSCVWWEGLRRLDADSSLSNVKISSLVNSLHNPNEKVWLVNKGNWVPPSFWSSLEIANYACASFPLEPLRKHSTAKSFQDGVRWLLFHFKPQNGPGRILLSQIWGVWFPIHHLFFDLSEPNLLLRFTEYIPQVHWVEKSRKHSGKTALLPQEQERGTKNRNRFNGVTAQGKQKGPGIPLLEMKGFHVHQPGSAGVKHWWGPGGSDNDSFS